MLRATNQGHQRRSLRGPGLRKEARLHRVDGAGRAGYVIADGETIRMINRFLETAVTCFPPFIQAASEYALKNCARNTAEFREELRKRRGLLEEGLSEIPALEWEKVEGAFYGFPKLKVRL